MFKINWVNVKSALVYGILWAILVVLIEMAKVGNVFALDWKELVNAGVFGFIAVFISLLKNLLTTDSGSFLGITKVIPDNK